MPAHNQQTISYKRHTAIMETDTHENRGWHSTVIVICMHVIAMYRVPKGMMTMFARLVLSTMAVMGCVIYTNQQQKAGIGL